MKAKASAAVALFLAATVVAGGDTSAQEEKFVTIGTGGQTGVYYVVGQSICRLVNRETAKHGIKCTAPATGASVANINSIRAGEMDLGVAQSDQQYNAYNGLPPFDQAGAFKELRAVFSLHPEPFTVVARTDSGIMKFEDLKGRRVNIGNPGSGQRATMEVVLAAFGWDPSVFALTNDLPAAQQSLALCQNQVEAMVYMVGHPNPSVAHAAGLCDAVLVPVSGPAIDKLLSENPFYRRADIPGRIYPDNPEPVPTFGVKATLVTSARLEPGLVYEVVKAVFTNLDRFRVAHPAFGYLDPKRMATEGLSAPLHEGAARYFRDAGIL